MCRRRMRWEGVAFESGDRIPEGLAANKGKLRRFWEAGWIELAEFEAPNVATGQIESGLPDGATLERRGSWHVVTLADGSERKANGLEAYRRLLADLGGA